MARSSYIYVLAWRVPFNGAQPILARTVKYEFVAAVSGLEPDMLAQADVWRFADRGASVSAGRVHLGTLAEFLAKEGGTGG